MIEKRKLKRWRLIYYMRIFERDSRKLLGHVVDITVEGLMLISEEPLETGKTFELWMEVPEEIDESGKVLLEAEAVWSKQDINPALFAAGFRLKGVPEETIAKIKDVIDLLKFDD